MQRCRAIGLISAFLFVGMLVPGFAGPSARAGSTDQSSDWYYLYFKEPVRMSLDVTRVAVFVEHAALRDGLQAELAVGTYSESTLTPHTLRHWAYMSVPAGMQTEAGVMGMIGDLANNAAVDFASPVFLDERVNPLLITKGLMVGFSPEVEADEAEALIQSSGAGTVTERDFAGLANVFYATSSTKNGFEALELVNALNAAERVIYAEPDSIFTGVHTLSPDDPEFSQQWGIKNTGQSGGKANEDMDGDLAWDVTTGDAAIISVVLDTGVQTDHPDLNFTAGKDFTGDGVPDGGPGNECDNHGTQVAGCIGAVIDNNKTIAGVAGGSLVTSGRMGVSGVPCEGTFSSSGSWLANALNWSHQTKKAKITNSSFKYGSSGTVTTAYNNAKNKGVINFAATGNDGDNQIAYPASLESVNAVGSVSRNGSRSSFSNYGPGIDFSAPGAAIRTLDRSGSDGDSSGNSITVDGTSFASPNAAGVAALILSVNSELTPDEVSEVIALGCRDKGNSGYDETYGWGFVNANNSIKQPKKPTLTQPTDGAVKVGQHPVFKWNSSSNTDAYDLTIDDNSDFSTPTIVVKDISATSYTLNEIALDQSTTYYWKITAVRLSRYWKTDSDPRSFTTLTDCNGNAIDDGTDITNGTSEDCNGNGRPDECDLDGSYSRQSSQLSPIGNGSPQSLLLVAPPDALQDVTLTVHAKADLNLVTEYVTITLNGVKVGDVFVNGGTDCPATFDEEALVVPAADWNAARNGGDVLIEMTTTSGVNKTQCDPDPTWISILVAFEGVPNSKDDNHNGVPDECEAPTAGVTISETGGSTAVTEGGATDSYSVVLNSQPTADVTINILVGGSDATVSPSTLTFTSANWSVPQNVTVTAVDDAIDEDAENATISHSATSGDSNYNGIAIASVVASVTDNDAAGVTISQSGGSTDVAEGGASDAYTAVLNTQPTADVTVNVSFGGGDIQVSPTVLTFTSANWNTAQTVTVSAVDDSIDEDAETATVSHAASSSDSKYNGIGIGSVTANIADNDSAGVTISQSDGSTDVAEGGASDTYTVVLNTQPTANVTVSVSFDPAQLTASPTPLTFTTANWSTAQTVTVGAFDDSIVEGAHASAITHSASSSDSKYNGVGIGSVTANITDNDSNALPGDMNCDGTVDFNDIDPFVAALISQEEYETTYPGCNWLNGDVNGDQSTDFNDIDGFVECLINGGC